MKNALYLPQPRCVALFYDRSDLPSEVVQCNCDERSYLPCSPIIRYVRVQSDQYPAEETHFFFMTPFLFDHSLNFISTHRHCTSRRIASHTLQGISVNVRQVSRAKAIAEKRQRGIESEPEGGSSRGSPGETDLTSKLNVVGVKSVPKSGGSSRWPKRRRMELLEVPNLSEQDDDQVCTNSIPDCMSR